MKRLFARGIFIVLTLVMVGCGGKTTALEGKVVDGKEQPLDKVTVAAKMTQPIKGYEHFETTTNSDGTFKFKKLFPTSEYQLIFYSDRWKTEKRAKTESGLEGQTKILKNPMRIRFMDVKEDVVLDTKTNLMWAAKDSGVFFNWANAKSYCENYRGGGFTDWRMPTMNEMVEIHKSNAPIDARGIIWSSDPKGSEFMAVAFSNGSVTSFSPSSTGWCWALPGRSGK